MASVQRRVAVLLVTGLALQPFLRDAATGTTFTRITDSTNPVVQDAFESGGGSWVDVNGDGNLDLFVSNGNLTSQNNSLYLNHGAEGFTKIVTGSIVNDGGSSIGSTWGDVNGDGLPDVFVTNRNFFGNFLYRGLGDSTFQKIATGGPVTDSGNSNTSSWVDVDLDGDLDLYVVNFGAPDFFYLNDGPGSFTFTRVDTVAMAPGSEFSIVGVWGDLDADGDSDLFIGNAGAQNDYLYLNQGGLWFTRTTLTDGRATLGASWGDYDNDGDLDLFAANFLNQASILYANSGPPAYSLSPVASPVLSTDPGNSVGTSWGDFDNDGDLDLFVARDGQNNALYENLGPPTYAFAKVTTGPEVTDGGNSFGAVWGDYDNDGQLDLFVANRLNQKNFLYRNDGGPKHWAEFDLQGGQANRSAIGAKLRVRATIGGVPLWQFREVAGQTGYNSQILRQHVGLGDASLIDSLIVEWPSGQRDVSVGLQVNRRYELVEGTTTCSLAMSFDLMPNTINLRSMGRWVTAYLEPPPPFAAADIDTATVRLNGTVGVDPVAPVEIGDHDCDGIPDLMVKFRREAVDLTVSDGDSVAVTVGGTVGGLCFHGTDYIRVARTMVSAPAAGSTVSPGTTTTMRWATPQGVDIQSVAVLSTIDDGATWNLEANGLPNSGTYEWMVPDVSAGNARVAVVLVETADETGYIVDGVFGTSGAFSIGTVTGVDGEANPGFALRAATPSPMRGALPVTFSLPDARPATIEAFNVSGRRVAGREVGSLGPGSHTLNLGERTRLPTGIYLIRLRQAGRSLTTRVVLIR